MSARCGMWFLSVGGVASIIAMVSGASADMLTLKNCCPMRSGRADG